MLRFTYGTTPSTPSTHSTHSFVDEQSSSAIDRDTAYVAGRVSEQGRSALARAADDPQGRKRDRLRRLGQGAHAGAAGRVPDRVCWRGVRTSCAAHLDAHGASAVRVPRVRRAGTLLLEHFDAGSVLQYGMSRGERSSVHVQSARVNAVTERRGVFRADAGEPTAGDPRGVWTVPGAASRTEALARARRSTDGGL